MTLLSNGAYALTVESDSADGNRTTTCSPRCSRPQGQQVVAPLNVTDSAGVAEAFAEAAALADGAYALTWKGQSGVG